ncbi:uncharacterized protein AC631_00023 [Debaryomyces fabryi]|uniref:GPI inositol-deacylase n=1 Tax=Debaryomyces fabryi TaxID=58627 RepID=A0A0V1Q6P8_9ASCO|nr:uncharacterized protein AC631_00023 [Debaryomyces fabryi]KSA04152.1 hypothetical protein AC631_00023 [Debaryomyces fabryi]CUM46208.1 unnamed protein product [Debaryomyces fabryi]
MHVRYSCVQRTVNLAIGSRVLRTNLAVRFYSAAPKKTDHEGNKVIDLQERKKEPIITDKFSTLKEKYEIPRYPIVLCHGFSGFDKLTFMHKPRFHNQLHKASEKVKATIDDGLFNIDYWYGIKEALENIGSTVLIAKVPPFGTIKERATHLNDFINKECDELRKSESKSSIYSNMSNKSSDDVSESATFEETNKPIKVNLIAHSMGGLDSRYLISQLKHTNYKVVSLTTISTPHHGSECADFIVKLLKNKNYLSSICPKSVHELTTSSMIEFNEKIKDDPNVSYFSYGARFNPKWFNVFKITWEIMKHEMQYRDKTQPVLDRIDNDGIVSVESSKWGRYLGTLDEVDHLDLINWTNKLRNAIDSTFFHPTSKFNAIALYLDIAENLSKRGF